MPIPTKTPLGVEEQRRRTAGLGQRHRTILFLVDGRRPLGEVLRLAQQAGATVQHFEDLVRLGHVEVPRPPEPPPAPAEPEVDEVTALSVDGAVEDAEALVAEDDAAPVPADTAGDRPPGDAPAALPVANPTDEPVPVAIAARPSVPATPVVEPETAVGGAVPAPTAEPTVAERPASATPAAPAPAAPTTTPWASAPVLPAFSLDLPPAAPPPPSIPVLGEVAVPRVSGAPLVPVGPPPWRKRLQVAAPISREDEKVLGAARARLLEALEHDPPLFGWGLAARIRGAATAPALVDATLELERTCDRRRRSPAGMAALEAARELLGLGNTVIDEDSRPAAWLDTR